MTKAVIWGRIISYSSVKDSNGKITHIPEEINKILRDFYRKLYSSNINCSDHEFLSELDLPKLNDAQITVRELPFSIADLYKALQHMPNRKTPAPAEFWPMLALISHIVVIKIKETSRLPVNMNCADVNLLLKPKTMHFHKAIIQCHL